jgi:hypothetical protein
MYRMNLIQAVPWAQNWWTQQQQKNADAAAKKELIPDTCDLCGLKIEEDDYYYLGFDRHMIYAATCTDRYCVHWLKWKIRRRKR